MTKKNLCAALLILIALPASMSSRAKAANWVEGESAWYTGASPGTKLTGTKVAETKIDPETILTLKSKISGLAAKITTTGVSCLSCVIENIGTHATLKGKLEFTGVKLVEPDVPPCEIAPNSLTTVELIETMGMKGASTTIDLVRVAPRSGSTLFSVPISGANCPIANTYKVTGVAYGEEFNPTGTFAETQTIKFSEAIQKDAGGTPSTLLFGGQEAFLEGTASNFLNPKTPFATKEK